MAKSTKPRKPRDLGRPTVRIHYVDATPEEIMQNRKNVEQALTLMLERTLGYHPTKFDWGEKPEWYGKDRVIYPEI